MIKMKAKDGRTELAKAVDVDEKGPTMLTSEIIQAIKKMKEGKAFGVN